MVDIVYNHKEIKMTNQEMMLFPFSQSSITTFSHHEGVSGVYQDGMTFDQCMSSWIESLKQENKFVDGDHDEVVEDFFGIDGGTEIVDGFWIISKQQLESIVDDYEHSNKECSDGEIEEICQEVRDGVRDGCKLTIKRS